MNLIDSVVNDPNLHPAFTLGVALHNPNVAAFDRQYLRRFLETPAPVSAFAELDEKVDSAQATKQQVPPT